MVQFNQLKINLDDEDHDQDVVEDLKEKIVEEVVESLEDPTVEGERFLLLSETVEQMAGNRAHLAEAVYLSKYLNRTLILPNVENSGLGIDRKYRFSTYFNVSTLQGYHEKLIEYPDFLAKYTGSEFSTTFVCIGDANGRARPLCQNKFNERLPHYPPFWYFPDSLNQKGMNCRISHYLSIQNRPICASKVKGLKE
jgi:hypothetical protein